MDVDRALALYDRAVRARPVAGPGMALEQTGGVLRLTGPFNFVCWWDLTSEGVRAAVAEQAAHVRARGEGLMWRVYEHDRPAELSYCLADEGFQPDPPGTLMIFDLANELTAPAVRADVRRVRTLTELDDFIAAAAQAFGEDEAWRRAAYAGRLDDPNLLLFVAYVGGVAAASARMETAPGCPFGSLYGGGVAPQYRGRGLYRALVAARAEEARRQGLAYLSIEARETSRPILQRLGFAPIVRETTWTLTPNRPPNVPVPFPAQIS
jgi:GNAT superfamily N-acetyltransferase